MTSKRTELPPLTLLREVGRRWPEAWKQYRQFRSMKGQPDFTDWPDWCYVPMAAAYAVASGGDEVSLEAGQWIAAISAVAAWRLSKGIYRFDADIYRELVEQPLDGKLPTAAFYSLPEWGIYIETPGMRSHGFFAHLEHDAKTGMPELRLLLLHPDGSFVPVPIMLGDWDLQTAVAKLDASSRLQQARIFGTPVTRLVGEAAEQYREMVVPYLQLVLYLCSANREVAQRRQRGRKRSKGKPSREGAPKEIREWEVGLRIGASIRAYRNQQAIGELEPAEEDDTPTEEGRRQRSPRPHVRRAHWHSFWTGPRDGERRLVLRWLPPIPVNVTETAQLPAVVRKVIKDNDDPA